MKQRAHYVGQHVCFLENEVVRIGIVQSIHPAFDSIQVKDCKSGRLLPRKAADLYLTEQEAARAANKKTKGNNRK